MYNQLNTQRIRSIDVLRGITILVMIFVNDVAGVKGIPGWMKHKAADADGMTFVDMVFPGFLFIVGMSLPFAINNRFRKGDSFFKVQGHILWRTLGLLVLGVFMVNAEGGADEQAMGMPVAVWSLLFYACAILVWNVYRFSNKTWEYVLRGIGAVGLVILAVIFRGEDGQQGLRPQWWGILGLIGWAYLFSCVIYQLFRGNLLLLILAVAACIAWYTISRADAAKGNAALEWMAARSGHAAHTSIVLCGIVVSLIFFDQQLRLNINRRFLLAVAFAIAAAIAAWLIRPYYTISKIYATPSWCLYSVAACTVLFAMLYWIADIRKIDGWTAFFQPAASNALLVYILPNIIYYLQVWLALHFTPTSLHEGIPGIAWSLCFAIFIMLLAMLLNRVKIRLQL